MQNFIIIRQFKITKKLILSYLFYSRTALTTWVLTPHFPLFLRILKYPFSPHLIPQLNKKFSIKSINLSI